MEFIVFGLVLLMVSTLLGGAGISYKHLRGTKLTPLWQVMRRLYRWQNAPRDTLVWGRFRIPLSATAQHILVAGTTRSGKTVMLRLLMQSVFPRIGQGESHRALVYDGKGELLNIVLGIKQAYQQVITFDPFDSEGLRWNIAADVTDDATANQAASLLFPKQDGEHQPFFSESVQNLASGIMQAFNEIAPGAWRLSHLLFVMRSSDRMIAVLETTAKGRDTVAQFQHSGETWGNISATISNRIRDYEIVAALHDNAKHAFSMKDWNETESILILQKSQTCSEVVDAMNRVLFTLAKRRLLSKPPSPTRRTWIIFDELASIKSKEIAKELGLLLEQGASRNIVVALAFQNISSLRDEFGEHGAARLVALCGIKALLRFEDYVSSEWASGLFGKQEMRMKNVSTTRNSGSGGGSSSSGTTINYQDQVRWVVEPSEFQAIAPPGAGVGITGFFGLPLQTSTLYRDTIPAKWVFNGKTLAPESDRVVVERPASQQQSQISEADIEQLLQGRVRFDDSSAIIPALDMEAFLPPSSPPDASGSAPGPYNPPDPSGPSRPPAPAADTTAIKSYLPVPASQAPHQANESPAVNPPGPLFQNDDPKTSAPQVWNLSDGTVQPASIWSVARTTGP